MARPPLQLDEGGHGLQEDDSTSSEGEQIGGADERQQTPDIYRNSALGMWVVSAFSFKCKMT